MFRTPTYVVRQSVSPETTYADVQRWWHGTESTAVAAREAVAEGAVCFVQLGGSSEVFVCVPSGECAVRPCRRVRGQPGTVVLMSYV